METNTPASEEALAPIQPGPCALWLAGQNLPHASLGTASDGIEMISVRPEDLLAVAGALHADGWNYLRLQCAYDEGPGEHLVSVYQLTRCTDRAVRPPEVRLKVFLPREDPRLPSVYWIWKAADWQERESYDMYGIIYEGHPNLIRILNMEDWVGWPLRKDYVTPGFYEVQDAF
jgi:NAD(P)H-quinone oxidoreductase subunit J